MGGVAVAETPPGTQYTQPSLPVTAFFHFSLSSPKSGPTRAAVCASVSMRSTCRAFSGEHHRQPSDPRAAPNHFPPPLPRSVSSVLTVCVDGSIFKILEAQAGIPG